MDSPPARSPRRPPGLSEELRDRLRAARLVNELSYKRLARLASVDRRHVVLIERGLRCPSRLVAAKLAVVLGLDAATTVLLLAEARPDVGQDRGCA